MSVEEKKKARFRFLEHLYNTVDGDSAYSVSMWELGAELEFGQETISQIVSYLQEEYLIEPRGLGGRIAISHAGIVEVEEALSNPEKSTEHFLPVNVINIQNMTNSAIQQGTLNSTQHNNFNISELKRLDDLLGEFLAQEELSDDIQMELLAEKETLVSQVNSPKPKPVIISESLKSIRNIVEGIAASALTPKIIDVISGLM